MLSPAILQNLAAADQAMEYDYCPCDFLESRRRNLMSFFLLTFPQGHEPLPDNFSGDWFLGSHGPPDISSTLRLQLVSFGCSRSPSRGGLAAPTDCLVQSSFSMTRWEWTHFPGVQDLPL